MAKGNGAAPPNPARGEVPLTVAGIDLVLCVEMERLAKLSAMLEAKTFLEIYQRLVGLEPRAVLCALETLAVQGDGRAARAKMGLADMAKVQEAVIAAFAAHMTPEEGAEPGKEQPASA